MLTRILSRFGFERRSVTSGDDNPFIPVNWSRAGISLTGVTPRSVLSNFAVAARCVALRSELLASVPLKLYRRLPNGDRERVSDTPLADVLSDLASPLHTAYELREFLTRSLDLHGNAYARIERDGAGQVTALWPLEPQRVTVERLETGRLRYRYSGNSGPVVLLQEETLHIRASSEDSLVGRSPLTIARGSFELGLALNEAAHSQAANGFKPAGLILHPGKLTSEAKGRIRLDVEKHASGAANAGRPAVFEEGMKWQSLSWSATDAQLLESRAMTAADIAYAFNLSPAILGLNESVSYGSAQQAAQDLVTNALAPLASRVEQAMQRCLLSAEARRTYVIEHDMDGLLRSDEAARSAAWKTSREGGWLSVNEIRRMSNRPGIGPAGDDFTPLRASPQQADPPIATTK
jgi:HK97 family phage portal protein